MHILDLESYGQRLLMDLSLLCVWGIWMCVLNNIHPIQIKKSVDSQSLNLQTKNALLKIMELLMDGFTLSLSEIIFVGFQN